MMFGDLLEPVSPQVSPLAVERRQVTTLFADISGFTALSEQLDPEAIYDLMNACFSRLVPIVDAYGGTVDKFIGDEIMALFGAPVSYENDAECAVHAALDMMKTLTAFNAEAGTDLGLHCGINTGLVIAGGIGSNARQDYSVMGDAVNLAARLEDASERGEIFVGPQTYRLTQSVFRFEPLEPMALKGKAEPVQVYRVLGRRQDQPHLPLRGTRNFTPLVGRDPELAMLRARWEQARDGEGQVVVLSGEAGIGKSRLVEALRDHLADEPHLWLECRSSLYHQNTALYPLTTLLRQLLPWRADDPPEMQGEKLERLLGSCRLPQDEGVLLLAALLGAPLPDDHYGPLALSPPQRRKQPLMRRSSLFGRRGRGIANRI